MWFKRRKLLRGLKKENLAFAVAIHLCYGSFISDKLWLYPPEISWLLAWISGGGGEGKWRKKSFEKFYCEIVEFLGLAIMLLGDSFIW